MAVNLVIPDGDPWYLSPNLWTVPGSNPEGAMGTPVSGEPCYLWARVSNTGTTPVQNATVKFYWANPAVGFNRLTANQIGSSFVSLDSGETSDVLCLTPWVPEYVNGGHECILAEAFHSSFDPLPATDAFNVPSDRHVAQRNLSVLNAGADRGMFKLSFEIRNPSRKPGVFLIKARQDKLDLLKPLSEHFGSGFNLPDEEGQFEGLGFIPELCPNQRALDHAERAVKLELGPGQRAGLTLVGQLEWGAALVCVEQEKDDRVVGGLSALVLSSEASRCKEGDQ